MADYIAEVAGDLFYREGLHAVGVDRVADTAGLTKRTLYRHFRTKDELIAASLRRAPRVDFPVSGSPTDRIMGAFELLEGYLSGTKYRGCPYIIFTAELTAPDHPARRLIEKLIAKRRAWFLERATEAGLAHPEAVAEELDLVFDGALASGAKRGDRVAAQTAVRLARCIVGGATTRMGEKADGTRMPGAAEARLRPGRGIRR